MSNKNMDTSTLFFGAGMTYLVYSLIQSWRKAGENIKKEKERHRLDKIQFELFWRWWLRVQPEQAKNFHYNELEPMGEWEWALLEHNPEHRKMFCDWYEAKLALYEFDPELAKKDAGHLISLIERAPTKEFEKRIINLLFA